MRLAIFFATCFGVFVLPFLLPAPYFEGVSASNLAGFNNRVSMVAAAGMATLVFFLSLKWPWITGGDGVEPNLEGHGGSEAYGRLSRSLVGAVVLLWGGLIGLLGVQIIQLGMRFTYDWGYFINRVSMHADFGRRLYTQIEFPYGPLLFYGPIMAREILSPFHVSAAGAYLVTITLEIIIGLLMVAYVISHLPMSGRWKTMIFLMFAVAMAPVNASLNYTLFSIRATLGIFSNGFAAQTAMGRGVVDLRWSSGMFWRVSGDRVRVFCGQLCVCGLWLLHSRSGVGVGSCGSHTIDGGVPADCGTTLFAHVGYVCAWDYEFSSGAAALHSPIPVCPGVAGSR